MSDEGSIQFRCPVCDKQVSFSQILVGLVQSCPYCFKAIVVPSDGSRVGRLLPLPLITPRLNLRPLLLEDLPGLVPMFADESSFYYTDSYPSDEDEVHAWLLESQKVQLTDDDGYINLGAELKGSTSIVGYISFFFSDDEHTKHEHRSGTFITMIAPQFRRQGFGTEIIRGILHFGFCGINLHDFRVSVDSRHSIMRALLERVGMVFEGEFVENRFVKDEWISTACYRMLRREYKPSNDVETV